MYNVQAHRNPRWCLVIDRDTSAALWKQTYRGGLLRIYPYKPF